MKTNNVLFRLIWFRSFTGTSNERTLCIYFGSPAPVPEQRRPTERVSRQITIISLSFYRYYLSNLGIFNFIFIIMKSIYLSICLPIVYLPLCRSRLLSFYILIDLSTKTMTVSEMYKYVWYIKLLSSSVFVFVHCFHRKNSDLLHFF